jgi:hypothetical protein
MANHSKPFWMMAQFAEFKAGGFCQRQAASER